ncbi:MAG: hypothetical protein CVU71_01070 [Deltaproteobacteria bacterium HGW-Deltaproteobacteria-6]|nr:MAG: hypothetical protein CVU71_01070 [Deltaproteobacteria bacterium HGW-Deltaproteobacteria-6]
MRKTLLIILIILAAAPVIAGDCDQRFSIYRAEVDGHTVYHVREYDDYFKVGFTCFETSDIRQAKTYRAQSVASCQAAKDAEQYQRKLNNAKWELVE